MLTPGRHYIGSTIRLTTRIYDLDDVDRDPGGVTCTVMSPSGVTTTYTYLVDTNIDRLNQGDYYCEFVPDESGKWQYRWVGAASDYTVTNEGYVRVQYSPIVERYVTGDYS